MGGVKLLAAKIAHPPTPSPQRNSGTTIAMVIQSQSLLFFLGCCGYGFC